MEPVREIVDKRFDFLVDPDARLHARATTSLDAIHLMVNGAKTS